MAMSNNSFKILLLLMKTPNKWLSVQSIAYDINITYRQAMSVILALDFDNVERIKDEYNKTVIRFHGDEEDVERGIRKAMREYYKITDSDTKKMSEVLSPAGWLSVPDIMEETGRTRSAVTRTLRVMDGVDKSVIDASTFYRRTPNV